MSFLNSLKRMFGGSPKESPKAAFAGKKPIGEVTHFFSDIGVAVIEFSDPPRVGAKVHFAGATTDFTQELSSVQYDHKQVTEIPKKKGVGVKVAKRVRPGDCIYLEQ